MKIKFWFKIGNYTYVVFQLYSIQAFFDINKNNFSKDDAKLNYLKHLRFIESLINSVDDRISYELRIVVRNQDTNTFKKIDIFLICQLENFKPNLINNYIDTIYGILNSTFEEYRFQKIKPDDFQNLLTQNGKNYTYSITRRITVEQLDTLKTELPSKEFGFKIQENEQTLIMNKGRFENDDKSIVYIFPFIFSEYKGEDFFSILSSSFVDNFDVRIKLKPTKLKTEEEDFIERQIIKCEKFRQIHINNPVFETDNIYPTLVEIAQKYQQNLLKFLAGLKKNCALMTVEIESNKLIPDPLLNLLATFFSSSPKSSFEDHFLYGGYEIKLVNTSAKNKNKIDTKKLISFNLPDNSILPAETKRLLYCFNSEEAICAFRFPPPPEEFIPNFQLMMFKERIAPLELIKKKITSSQDGFLIGLNRYKNLTSEIILGKDDLKKHVYIIGQTGTGKTTLLMTMILDSIRKGEGVCVIDPHGDLFNNLLGKIPKKRRKDVIVFDPTDSEYAIGLNFLEYNEDEQRYFIANEFVGIIKRLLESEYGFSHAQEITGPIFYKYLRFMTLLVMSNKSKQGTLLDLYKCFSTENTWEDFKPIDNIDDPLLNDFISELSERNITKPSSDNISLGEYVGSKLQNFVFDKKLRNIFGQKKSTINLLEIMNQGKILLVNLAKGILTEENSRFLGMLLMTKLMASSMERVKISEENRKNFYLFIDEFQNIATTSFTTMLSEARKFGLSLILANQFIEQIMDPKITLSIFGNVGTFICFRLGQIDAQKMEQRFLPYVSSFHLTNLPNWHAYVITLNEGKNTIPFIIETIVDKKPYSPKVAKEVINTSRAKYSKKIEDLKLFSNNVQTENEFDENDTMNLISDRFFMPMIENNIDNSNETNKKVKKKRKRKK